MFATTKFLTEADVEQKLIGPLLTMPEWLGLPQECIRPKDYLPATDIDKGAAKKYGYFPDYSIWVRALPLVVIEAKAPDESVEEGYREASLYAHEINKRYPTKINPVTFIIATNGRRLLFGPADTEQHTEIPITDLARGNQLAEKFCELLRYSSLEQIAAKLSPLLSDRRVYRPINAIGGEIRLTETVRHNSFADDLYQIVRMFFGSDEPERIEEIVQHAYVSSDETNRRDRAFESDLRNRIDRLRPNVKAIASTAEGELGVSQKIEEFSENFPIAGQLQLVIGPIGAGKSLFTRRYFVALQSEIVRQNSFWSFINFNNAPDDLSNLDTWLADKFIDGLSINHDLEDLYERANLEKIFSVDINKRRGIYKGLGALSLEEHKSADLAKWVDDKRHFAKQICRYIVGDTRRLVVVVFDNVDRRDREQQLRIFSAAQAFRTETRTFCILNLRDETFERFKNEPPLDAFANSMHFYVTPPRFADVVRKLRWSRLVGQVGSEVKVYSGC